MKAKLINLPDETFKALRIQAANAEISLKKYIEHILNVQAKIISK